MSRNGTAVVRISRRRGPLLGGRLGLWAAMVGIAGVLGTCGASPAAAACVPGTPGPVSFAYTGGEACYTVGVGVNTLHVVAIGAGGSVGPSGPSRAASVTTDLAVSPGETLYVEVGGTGVDGGFNGGGLRTGAPSGGGASDVRTCALPCAATPLTGQPLTDPRLVVAGGGGGSGAQNGVLAAGGAGGDAAQNGGSGAAGTGSGGAGGGGGGATPSDGGGGGLTGGGGDGLAGTVGTGAAAAMTEGTNGGAGGGGWFGGGSGGSATAAGETAGGGGGGSSFGPAGGLFASSSSTAVVTIAAPTAPPPVPTPAPVSTPASPSPAPGAVPPSAGAAPAPKPAAAAAAAAATPTHPSTRATPATPASTPAATRSTPTATPSTPPTQPSTPAASPPVAVATPSTPAATPSTAPAAPAPSRPAAGPASPAGLGSPTPTSGGGSRELPRYDLRSQPKKVVGLAVVAYTLLELGAGGGLALAGLRTAGLRGAGLAEAAIGAAASGVGAGRGGAATGARTRGKAPGGGSIASAGVKHIKAGGEGLALGDRSRTWRWPGTAALDDWSRALPGWLATRSPLTARLVTDGSYLRSIFGSASILLYAGGVALGVAGVADSGGHALPPSTFITFAALVLGVIDAGAGFMAVLTFFSGVAVLGGIDSAAALRTILGLSALWFVVPLLAGAARPLRRPPAGDVGERVDRCADFVIASLIGAWAVQKIVSGLSGLAGYVLPITAHADDAAIIVLVAVTARLAAESLAIGYYPERLATVQAVELADPRAPQRLGAIVLRTAIFLLVVTLVVRPGWQLWVGTALFVVPQILSVYEARLPSSPRLFRALPRGLLKLVLMLFVGTAVGVLVTDGLHGSKAIIDDSFVLLALPGLVLTLLGMIGRDGDEPAIRWRDRAIGVVLLGAGVALVLGYITI